MGTESTTAQATPAEFTRFMMNLAQEKGEKLTIASAGPLELEADDVTFKCVSSGRKGGDDRNTGDRYSTRSWTVDTKLASKLLGKRAGAALDIGPRFVTHFPTPRSLLTTRVMPQTAGV